MCAYHIMISTLKDLFLEIRKFDRDNIENSLQKLQLGTFDGYPVYSVNGDYVKRNYSMDFVEAGHWLRYKFIPEGEFWVDNNLNNRDYAPNLLHEYREMSIMILENLDYDDAHEKFAQPAELQFREEEFKDKFKGLE